MAADRVQKLEQQLAEKEQELRSMVAQIKYLQQRETEHRELLDGLVGRMVHDMNNLNSRIHSSGCTISHAFGDLRQHLPVLCFDLQPELQQKFFALIEHSYHCQQQHTQRLSSREERRLRRALVKELEQYGIEGADETADLLVDMGISGEIESFIPLLQCEYKTSVLQAAYSLMCLQDINRWNLMPASSRITQIAYTLKNAMMALLADEKIKGRITASVENVLGLYQYLLESREITVVKHYEELPVSSWYAGLDLVWMNLLENAIEAINRQGTLEIMISNVQSSSSECQKAITVQVTDSGCGIPDDIRNRIFDRSVTTKTTKAAHGAGLYLVHKIICKHHGKIGVESQPGRTTFSVWLPLAEEFQT